MTAQVDTHPKGGDCLLAPFMGSAVGFSRCAMNTPLARYDDNGADLQIDEAVRAHPSFGGTALAGLRPSARYAILAVPVLIACAWWWS